MKLSSAPVSPRAGAPALWLLEDLPGIADVVWSILSRVRHDGGSTRLVFIASESRAGNTVVAAATAVSLARHLRVPVCLIETNVAHPALASYLGLQAAGVSDILDGRAKLEESIQTLPECPDLLVLPAGTPRKPTFGEFATPQMRAILDAAEKRARFVIIDAPPALDHVESRLLLQDATGAVLVLRSGTTRIDAATRAQRILLEAGTPLLGSVFNAYGPAQSSHTRQAYGYPRAPDAPKARSRAGSKTEAADGDDAPAVDEHAYNGNGNGNGSHAVLIPVAAGMISEHEHQRQIDMLERRIAKLTEQLEHTESDLRRIAAMKGIDLGIASIYRGVQGLSSEEDALAMKKELMLKIFEANLELKQTMDRRHPSGGARIAT